MVRRRIATALEALPWLAVAAYLMYLAAHFLPGVAAYRQACGLRSALPWGLGCTTHSLPRCNLVELALLVVLMALLLWLAVRRIRPAAPVA